MNLLQIREKFVRASGRWDLVDDVDDFTIDSDNTSNNADEYITEGQKWLERKLNVGPTSAKYYKDLTIGEYLIRINHCRAVHEVWVLTDESRDQLTKLDAQTLRDYTYTVPLSSATQDQPAYYYPTNLRRSPDDEDGSGDSTLLQTYIDTYSPSDLDANGLIIFPPPDAAYGLEIVGLFYDAVLSADTDENYWSVNYPDLLVAGAMYRVGSLYKGAKTLTELKSLINDELEDIIKDDIETEISHTDQMRG